MIPSCSPTVSSWRPRPGCRGTGASCAAVLAAALSPPPGPPGRNDGASRPVRALRALTETPAVLYAELSESDAESLRAVRELRSSEAASLIGGHVEARAEGLALIIDDEPRSPATSDWPGSDQTGWV